jgi:hypothetical protein
LKVSLPPVFFWKISIIQYGLLSRRVDHPLGAVVLDEAVRIGVADSPNVTTARGLGFGKQDSPRKPAYNRGFMMQAPLAITGSFWES